MSNRKITPIEFSRELNKVHYVSVFETLIKQVDAKLIPARYVEFLIVTYLDGSTVSLTGSELISPIPIHRDKPWSEMGSIFKKIKSIKLYIDTRTLELDVNRKIEDLFRR